MRDNFSLCDLDARCVSEPHDFLSEITNQFFNQIRDFLEIGIGPVAFEHREFRIVLARNAFVAEVAVHFEDLVEPADEQTFQIKLRRNAQIKIEPERLVMGAERFAPPRRPRLFATSASRLQEIRAPP